MFRKHFREISRFFTKINIVKENENDFCKHFSANFVSQKYVKFSEKKRKTIRKTCAFLFFRKQNFAFCLRRECEKMRNIRQKNEIFAKL